MNTSAPPVVEFVKAKNTTRYAVSLPDAKQHHPLMIGQILMEMGKINQQDNDNILQLQKNNDMLFGDAAKQIGLVSDGDVRQALACQQDGFSRQQAVAQSAPRLPALDEPESPQVEAVRAIRTQLMLNGFPSDQKSLALVGISRDCGAGHFSANLAVLFSQLGLQTLLVDANLRKPAQQELFNLPDSAGLGGVLNDQTALEGALITFQTLPHLTLLPAGAARKNASELIGMSAFKTLNKRFAADYDIVLYDVPAFIESTDALMIVNQTDYVLLLVHKNHSRLADVSAVCKQITDSGAKIIGSILVDY